MTVGVLSRVGLDDILTSKGDIVVASAAGVAARLAKGADSQVLTIDPAAHVPYWADAVAAGPTLNVTSTAGLVAAIAVLKALAPGGGLIQCARGTYTITAGQLALNGVANITIRGVGGRTQGATMPTVITYAGAGSSPAIDIRDANVVTFEDVAFQYTNAAFTGALVGTDGSTTNALVVTFRRVIFDGVKTYGQTAILCDLNQTIEIHFELCLFKGGGYGVRGRKSSASTDFSNIVSFINCEWGRQSVAPVYNPGESWGFYTCNFEGKEANPSGSDVGAIFHASGVLAKGLVVTGCWFGDQTTTSAGAWITYGGSGLSVTGNRFGGRQVSTIAAVKIDENATTGVVVEGNDFDNLTYGLDFGATTGAQGKIGPNGWTNVVAGWKSYTGTVPKGIEILDSAASAGRAWVFMFDGSITSTKLQFDGDAAIGWVRTGAGVLFNPGEVRTGLSAYVGYLQTATSHIYGAAGGTVAGMEAQGSNANVPMHLDAKGTGGINLNTLNGATGGTKIESAAGKVGFFGATPGAKVAITGSRGANAALASLLTELAAKGLITDSTT